MLPACRYPAYKARKQLAAIDWNYHLNLPQAKTTSGDEVITRKYNNRTRQWGRKSGQGGERIRVYPNTLIENLTTEAIKLM